MEVFGAMGIEGGGKKEGNDGQRKGTRKRENEGGVAAEKEKSKAKRSMREGNIGGSCKNGKGGRRGELI